MSMRQKEILVEMLDSAGSPPTVKHEGDAGMDVYALEGMVLQPHTFGIVRTGVRVSFPEDLVCQVWPKSRNNHLIGAGIIDANYTGEILIKVYNSDSYNYSISAGDAVAQLVFVHNQSPYNFKVVEKIEKETSRGATGGIVSQLTFDFSPKEFDADCGECKK